MAMAPILRQAPRQAVEHHCRRRRWLVQLDHGPSNDWRYTWAPCSAAPRGPIALMLLLIAADRGAANRMRSTPRPAGCRERPAAGRHQAAADHGREGRGPRGPALGRDGRQPARLGRRAGAHRAAGHHRAPARRPRRRGDAGPGARRVRRPRVRAGGEAGRGRPRSPPGSRSPARGPRSGPARPRFAARRTPWFPSRPRSQRTESEVEWAKSELERNEKLFRGRADRRARRRQRAQPPQCRGGPDGRRHLRPRSASGPDAHRRGAARLRPRRAPRRRGRGRAPRGDARDRQEAARRHHDPRALRGRDRQAPRERRRIRQGQYPALQPGGGRPAQVHGHGARALRAGSEDRPAHRADRGGLPRPELRGPGHARVARGRGADPQPRPRGPRRQWRRPAAPRLLRQGPRPDEEGRLGGIRPRRGRRVLRRHQQGVRRHRRQGRGAADQGRGPPGRVGRDPRGA